MLEGVESIDIDVPGEEAEPASSSRPDAWAVSGGEAVVQRLVQLRRELFEIRDLLSAPH